MNESEWHIDTEKGVFWMQEDDEEWFAREEFVRPDFEFAAIMLGTTAEALENATPAPVPPSTREEAEGTA